MIRFIPKFVIFTVTICLFTTLPGAKMSESGIDGAVPQFDFDAHWSRYDSLQREGLTQSAVKEAELLYTNAKKLNNIQEMIRALLASFSQSSRKDENSYVKAVNRIESELATSKFPVTSVLHIILVNISINFILKTDTGS